MCRGSGPDWRAEAGARVWSPLPPGPSIKNPARDEASGAPRAGRGSASFFGLIFGVRVLSPALSGGRPGFRGGGGATPSLHHSPPIPNNETKTLSVQRLPVKAHMGRASTQNPSVRLTRPTSPSSAPPSAEGSPTAAAWLRAAARAAQRRRSVSCWEGAPPRCPDKVVRLPAAPLAKDATPSAVVGGQPPEASL